MDILKDIKQKMCCENISELRNINKDIDENLDLLLLIIDPKEYSVEQWQELSRYLFPKLQVDLPNDVHQLRDNLVLAIRTYREIRDRIIKTKKEYK